MQRDVIPVDADRVDPSGARRALHRIDGEGDTASHAAVVVGHDGEPQSQAALDVAIDLARRLRAHLHVVHARDLGDAAVDPDSRDWEEDARHALTTQRALVRAALSGHESGWTYHAGRGDPAELLTRVATEHDALMIVVGSRGEGWHVVVERLVSPAVSHRLIEHAGRPVLVVGPRQEQGAS